MGVFSFSIAWLCVALAAMFLSLICFVCLILLFRKQQADYKTGRTYTPFYIENGQFIINNAIRSKYALSDVSHVILGIFKSFGGMHLSPGYSGYIRIVKIDGKMSPKYLFDGSVYTKRTQFVGTNDDLLKSLKLIENELNAASIRYTILGEEKIYDKAK